MNNDLKTNEQLHVLLQNRNIDLNEVRKKILDKTQGFNSGIKSTQVDSKLEAGREFA